VTDIVQRLMASPAFARAMAHLDAEHERLNEETIALQQSPAPYRQEGAKAAAYGAMLDAAGLSGVETDAEGNVTAIRKGTGAANGMVALVSHLDTVFGPDVDLTVRREGTRLVAPGMADNTRGVASHLALIRALDAAGVRHARDILFVGSVGEEGLGDLRGVKHLLGAGKYKEAIARFIALDGSSPERIVDTAVGSRRYRVTFTGPGGHSYAAFGTVNPAFSLGAAAAAMGGIAAPEGTTYSVGVLGGGTSINAIPLEAWMEIDLRSSSPADLDALETQVRRIVEAAVADENRVRSTDTGTVAARFALIGERPAGRTPPGEELLTLARDAVAAHGWDPTFVASSTDANVPIALGLPAVTIASGIGGRAHSTDEYLDIEKCGSLRVLGAALATLLAAAEMEV
jgi:acetylornithine deacetylase/succinyl-diaminopimelate desuccinylase-like protein